MAYNMSYCQWENTRGAFLEATNRTNDFSELSREELSAVACLLIEMSDFLRGLANDLGLDEELFSNKTAKEVMTLLSNLPKEEIEEVEGW